MFKNKKYFTKGQYLFWGLIILFLVLAIFHFSDGVFQREGIAKQIVSIEKGDDFDTLDIVKNDSTKAIIDDSILFKSNSAS